MVETQKLEKAKTSVSKKVLLPSLSGMFHRKRNQAEGGSSPTYLPDEANTVQTIKKGEAFTRRSTETAQLPLNARAELYKWPQHRVNASQINYNTLPTAIKPHPAISTPLQPQRPNPEYPHLTWYILLDD
ncbi:hypothetical protein LguiA_002546 [Lonicera macranthoides]